MKRLISVLLLIALIFSYFPAIPLEAKAATEGDYTFSVYRGEATIDGYTGPGGDITIPSALDGYPVTGIGMYAFDNCDSLTAVAIPDSVIIIGSYAFEECANLKSITIGESVTSIGYEAFAFCNSLTSVTIGDSVTDIGEKAFYDCYNLTAVTIPDSVITIGKQAFFYCTGLTSVTIGNNVATIDDGAFNMTGVATVTIPASVTKIGEVAFGIMQTLTDVYYDGTQTQWNAIEIHNNNDDLRNATMHFLEPELTEYTYTVENGKATITGYNGAGGDVIIPDTLGGCSVTAIGDEAFWGCTSMTSVKIPDTVITIGDYAFCYCTKLTSVTIPDSVKTIGEYAFAGYLDEETGDFASSLTSVTIGSGVTTIGADAFSACGKLTSVTIPDNVTRIDFGAFCFCYNLNSVTIGKGVTAIPDFAFRACEKLTTVTIPASVTTIGEYAFSYCTELTDVYYDGTENQWNSIPVEEGNECLQNANMHFAKQEEPENAEYTYTVENGEAIITGYNGAGGDIIIPATLGGYPVTRIGEDAFYGCTSLTSVEIPDGVTKIGEGAFMSCNKLTTVNIPNSVTIIGECAFYGCSYLDGVEIPNSVTKIGVDTFAGCIHLTSITIPDSVTAIYEGTFYYCESLTAVTIPESVTYIGENAFANCTKLTDVFYNGTEEQWNTVSVESGNEPLQNANMHFAKQEEPENAEYTYTVENGEATITGYTGVGGDVIIPATLGGYPVTEIGKSAFSGCDSLTSVMIPGTVKTIGSGAFRYCANLTMVTIPDSVTSIDDFAFYLCESLTTVTIPNGVTAIGRDTFSGCASLTSVTIPDGMTTIGAFAFSCCTSLTSVTIPGSVTTIGGYAFSGCTSLTSVTIPDGVTTIGENTFSGCTSLTSVTIPDGVTTIGENTFSGCTGLTFVKLPNGISTIGESVFSYCYGLTSVTIPDSVTGIGENAFYNCTKLTDVYYDGTEEQWNTVSVESGNEYLQNATVHFPEPEVPEVTDYTYTVENGEATITGYTGTGGDITIPSALGGYPVTTIGEFAFSDCTNITSVTIPDSVTEIGRAAFVRCTNLTAVIIPDGVTTIGDNAFESCESLLSVIIPDSVAAISNGMFNRCTNLISVTIPDSVTTIGDHAFYYCTGLTTVTIPDSVTTIGEWAFIRCSSLTSVTIPNSVTTIGDEAFKGCTSLTTVTIPDSVTSIGEGAFSSCTSLTSVTIPNSITIIGESAFSYCYGLTSVTIPDGVTTIGNSAFYYCHNLTAITIPETTTVIGESAFENCWDLTYVYYIGTKNQWESVAVGEGNACLQKATVYVVEPESVDYTYTVENGEATITGYTGAGGDITVPAILGGCPVTRIGHYAFERNNDLTSVVIPGTVKTIGFGAFRYCPNLASVTLGDGIVDMGVQTFRSCTSLKSFVIPDSVTEISAEVFYECTGLEEVTIGSGVTAIGDSAFRFCDSLKTVELPAALQSIGHLAFYSCDNLSAYYVHEDNVFFASEQGVLFNKDKTELVLAPMAMTGAYVVPETVKKIGDMAFHSCSGLTSIDLGSNVTTIGETAFSGCGGLTSLIIPDSVTQLGYQAFYGCSGLTSVTIGTGITEIPESVFYLCTGLETLTIPDHITVIGCSAFDSCHGLTEVTLPAGLTLVKEGAFDYCNNLTDVYYKGTRRQWNFLTIQEKNDILFSAYVHCGDEQETPDAKDFVYEIKNGEATIIGYKGAGGDIEISPIWAGYPVTAIAKDAFYWNSWITGVTIPGSVKRIDDNAFFNCANMVTLTLAEGVQEIGSSAFFACDKLASVVIPDSVTKIESEAFCLCGSLQSVTLGKGVQTIESGAFAQCEELVSIQVDPNNVFFRDVNGVLFSGTTLVQYPGGRSGSYTVPSGTTAIGSNAFCWTDHLTEVTLPDSVKTIGSNAFWYSGIKKIQLGKNLETIGYGAFELSNLTEIHIPDSVTTIEGAAFKECYVLKTVRIGLGVKTIGYEAFCWCFPETVYYAGTRAQWDTIEIAGYNDDLLNANIVYEGDHTHSYVAKVTKPTCTEKGYTTYTCACGDTYVADYVNVTSHSYAAATCTKPKTCKVCGATSGKALGHSYKSGSCIRCKYKPAGAKITTQPTNAVVASGKTATVTIKASGTGIKYTWYYAKKGAKSYTKASSTTNSYSLKMSSSYDGTKVYCVVSDAYGNSVKSAVVTLYKGTPAKITAQPKSTTVANGKSGSITLKASGSSLKYQWYIKYKGASAFAKVGKSSKTYSFKMASKLDGAQVYCVVKDKYGIEVKSSTVTIKMPVQPKITTQPKSVKAFSGKTVKFTVKASGEGLKYQWYYAKKGSNSFKKLSAKSATYSVKVSSSVDGRKYYCLVTDQYGQTVKSSVVTLTMQRAAKILTQPKNVSVKNGKTAKVTIKAEGDGLKYTWYYLLTGETKYRKATFTGNAFSVTMSAKYKNAKVYCAISDQYGNTVKSKTVTLKMK